MNVAYFLTPKAEVVWVAVDASMRHAFERMEQSRYTAIPMLDLDGRYTGTVTEGDLLRHLMYSGSEISAQATERVRLQDVTLRIDTAPVDIDANVEELFERALKQNFVPVQDSRGIFIGIVRRREILEYCTRHPAR
jgi:CBS-domain-containing membrane protein